MASTDKSKGNFLDNVKRYFAKEPATDKEDASAPARQNESENSEEGVNEEGACSNCNRTLFVLLCAFTVFGSIADMAASVWTAIFIKLYDSEQSGRLVGMVMLAVVAAVAITALLNLVVAVFKKRKTTLNSAAAVLFVVAGVQVILMAMAVRVTPQDELILKRSLDQSFFLKDTDWRHGAMWSSMQHSLRCCGVKGPLDYQPSPAFLVPSNLPISCCDAYDPNRSELVQERERDKCKSRSTFHKQGCETLVMEGFKASASFVLGLTINMVILEVIVAVIALVLARKIAVINQNEKPESDNGTLPQP